MAEQTSEHQPLLNKSTDEGAESDPEQPPHISHSEGSTSVAAPENVETTPAVLDEGTFVSYCDKLNIHFYDVVFSGEHY